MEAPSHVTHEFAEEMARLGLLDEIADAPTEDDVKAPDYEVWPDNLTALNLFLALEHQWDIVVSPDGELIRTCIKTTAIEFKLKYRNGVPKKAHAALVEQMEWMERAALAVMNKARVERMQRRADELEHKR